MNQDIQNSLKHKISRIRIKEDSAAVYFDDDKILIDIDEFYQYRLSEGKEIEDETYDELVRKGKFFTVYRSCIRKLASRDRTVRQMKEYLKGQKLDKDESDSIIDRLISYGLLDDEAYCESKAAYYDASLMSYRKMIFKLRNEGVDEDLIREKISFDDRRETEKASQIAEKMVNSVSSRSSKALKQKILSRLGALGFSYDICRKALDNLSIEVKNELELLSKEYDKSYRKYSRKYEGYELRSKVYSSLLLKGFNSDDIKNIMEVNDVQES